MAVTIKLPEELERRLRADSPNLDSEAREAMLIGLYRQDKLSHYELSLAMGLNRFGTDGLLNKHNVTEDLPTQEEYAIALRRLEVLCRI